MEILTHFKDSFWLIIDNIGFQLFVFADYVVDLAEGDEQLLLVMIGLGFALLVLLLLMSFMALRGRKKTRRRASEDEVMIAAADAPMSLEQIEREMLDIREQYKTGRISAEVYVETSKALYEKSIGR